MQTHTDRYLEVLGGSAVEAGLVHTGAAAGDQFQLSEAVLGS